MRSRMQRVRITLLAAVTLGAAVLFYSASPAHADVDRVSGSAFAVSARVLGASVIAPTPPGVAGEASEPENGYGPLSSSVCPADPGSTTSTVCVNVPGLLTAGLLNARTEGGRVAGEDHLGFATSSASVANVALGNLFISAVRSTCTADGNGARGSTELVGATNEGVPVVQTPAAGTEIDVVGIGTVILNEQIVTNTEGVATITVNAVHVKIPTATGGVLDIILAQSVCGAFGPNVNVTTTTTQSTTTTLDDGTTTTTQGNNGTTSTTQGNGTTSTTQGNGTTSTTGGGGGPTTTGGGGGGTNTTAGGGGGTATTTAVRAGLLARTGATMHPAMLMAFALTVLGMLMFFGSRGLTDPAGRTFVSHPMFRPVAAGRPRVLPGGASSRLDAAALDALTEMEGMGGGTTQYDGTPPEGSGRRGRHPRQWFTQRPW